MTQNAVPQLFRQQAVAKQSEQLMGKVMAVPSISAGLVTLAIVLWLVLTIVWLVTAQYARHVNVQGWIEPETGVAHHYSHSNSGSVDNVHVVSGQQVEEGQVIMRINKQNYTRSGVPTNQLLTDELYAQMRDIQQTRQRLDAAYNRNLSHNKNEQHDVADDINRVDDIAVTLDAKHVLALSNELKMTQLNEKGWVSTIELSRARNDLLTVQAERFRLDREKIHLNQKINALQQQLKQMPGEHETALANLDHQHSELNQRRIQLQASQYENVIATTSGIVSEIFVKNGQKVDVSKPLLTILPNNNRLIANIVLPASAAGFVEKGQTLQIRYDAFPHEKFGLYESKIESVADSVLLPTEVQNLSVAISEPVYVVRARLAENSIAAYGTQVPLKSGMTLSAQISTGNRTLLEWLFEPLFTLAGRV